MFSHTGPPKDEEFRLGAEDYRIAPGWWCQLDLLPGSGLNIETDADVIVEDEKVLADADSLDGLAVEKPVRAGDEVLLWDVCEVLPLKHTRVLHGQRLVAGLNGQVKVDPEDATFLWGVIGHRAEGVYRYYVQILVDLADIEAAAPAVVFVPNAPK